MKKYNKILLALVLGITLQSCALYKIPKLAKQGEVKQTDYVQETSFNYTKDLIFIAVEIKGKTYNFMFDTGAELSIIGQHITGDIDFNVITSSKINATEESTEKLEFIEVPNISIAGVAFENTGAIVTDISHIQESMGCNPIDGIIGNNLIRKASWQIDYKNEKLIFSDHVEKLHVSENAFELTMDAGEIRNVYVDVTIDSVSSTFIFDTGCSCSVRADSSFFNRLIAKHKGLAYSTATGITHMDINGKITGKTINVLANSIDIEGIVISNQVISGGGNNSYLVGNKIFKNYTLTIDWKNDKLFFDPTTEFEADTLTGFEFSFAPNYKTMKIEITRFQDDHKLDAEISMDAEILEINGVNVSHFELEQLCSYWELESERIRNAKSLDIVVLDKGITKNINLTNKVLLYAN